ncbi:MAG: LacI family DNA-binding transcriptional regulator [Solirubrobacteraceae bacterium]|nr:LacI family DNA-binding transcriptional regulator [Patulibacter sp.]
MSATPPPDPTEPPATPPPDPTEPPAAPTLESAAAPSQAPPVESAAATPAEPGPTAPAPAFDPAGRPTLRTLSNHTGLHVSTISRALRRDAASDETAALVHAAATELGYRRDPIAASLRTQRSHAIGMVAHALTDVVQAIIYEEVDRVALEHGYDVLVASTRDEPAAQRQRVELLLSRRVDGLILADAHGDGAYADWVASLGVPYVLVMRGTTGGRHPSVIADDVAGGRLVAEHLVAQGHTTIALLSGPEYSGASRGRAEGFRTVLAEAGVALTDDLVEPGGLVIESGRAGMQRLLERRPDLTAVFCASDFSAFGATSALRAAGLRPGEDVATVGFNDVAAAEAMDLTSVRTPQEEMGRLATLALLEAIDGGTPASHLLAPELIVRGSSAASLASMRPAHLAGHTPAATARPATPDDRPAATVPAPRSTADTPAATA